MDQKRLLMSINISKAKIRDCPHVQIVHMIHMSRYKRGVL